LNTLVGLLELSAKLDDCTRVLPSKLWSPPVSLALPATRSAFTSRSFAVVVQSVGSEVSMFRRLVAVFLLNPVTMLPEILACGLFLAAVLTRSDCELYAV